MCLAVIAWNCHDRYPLLIAANRDEEHARAAAPAAFWADAPDVVGGRDLAAGGSWLAMNRNGRYALVLNQPARPPGPEHRESRGELVRNWVTGRGELGQGYLGRVREREADYAGFTLVVGTAGQLGPEGLITPAGRAPAQWRFPEGITALSNSSREDPLPKAQWLERRLQQVLAEDEPDLEAVFAALARRDAVVASADAQRIGRLRVTPFLEGQLYGTRCSTLVSVDRNGRARFVERRFGPGGEALGETALEFGLGQAVPVTIT